MTITDREQWLAERKKGITATDISAICGYNQWKRPIDVYREKRGLIESDDLSNNPQIMWGIIQEPVIAEFYRRKHNVELTEPGLLIHKSLDWVRGTPDRLIVDRPKGLEVKTSEGYVSYKWGEPGSDDVPKMYLLQCAWYMLITDLPEWDIAVKIGNSDYREYTIERNQELESNIIQVADEFWHKNVLEGNPPKIDGSDSYKKFITSTFPQDNGSMLVETPEVRQAAIQLARAKDALREIEGEVNENENYIKSAIGEASGIEGNGWKCTFKKAKDSVKVDYEAALDALAKMTNASPEIVKSAIKSAESTRKGSRRFLFRPSESFIADSILREVA